MDRIILDPSCLINYASYYIIGLKLYYPNLPIIWDSSKFPYTFKGLKDYRQGIGIILEKDNELRKFFIDFHDSNQVLEQPYKWCDVYGKINVKKEDLNKSKILPIGPSFGVRFTNVINALKLATINYFSIKDRGWKPDIKSYLSSYVYQFLRRKKFEEYVVNPNENENYIFALSTLWYDDKTDTTTNIFRANFSRLCKKLMPAFEGGLLLIEDPVACESFPKYTQYRDTYSDLIINKRIPMKEYIDKTAQSAFVFNTPSVEGCHGWKLAEYLGMGKAIISTPLENIMPGDLREGKEYLCVRSEKDLEQAILYLRDNPEERLSLKRNAKNYFESYLRPDAVIKRLVDHKVDN